MNQSIILFIAGWYFCSITLSLYNKWMFDPSKGLSVPYPLMVTTFHQLLLWIISGIYLKSTASPRQEHSTQEWKFYFKYIVPTALATAGDIGLGNVSFKFIALTIYTIVKSSSIAFVLLFGCLLHLEKFQWKLMAVVVVMFGGVVMMAYKPDSITSQQPDHTVLGVFLVLGSSCLSGLRWVYTQIILQKGVGPDASVKRSPIETIHQFSPIMGVALFAAALIVEKPFPAIFKTSLFTWHDKISALSILRGFGLLVIPGIQVFLMTICELGILQRAQVLTLSIAGIVKELLTIVVSMIVLHERLSGIYNWAGMCIILLDVCYYNFLRYKQKTEIQYRPMDDEYDIDTQEFELEQRK
ncbi:LAFE_0F13652g1_1 [Lachancea fermentati]|uniref:LAFE_0F13652g1_1 n=1 Tax=Lachancea fermentati TaxID=4955 RepID=A0A1G4MFV9_LACFM|nr:LAFE_0F13652g1_1 [Lachancea fermentati]